jgi:dolichyl-phosphate-mannose-protein mannosyltransferase
MRKRPIQFAAALLLILGLCLWLVVLQGARRRAAEVVIPVALLAALVPDSRRFVQSVADGLDRRAHRRRGLWAAGVAVAVGLYLMIQVAQHSEQIFPRFHDEHSYLIQAQMLARGRLWMPAYPPEIQPFFDNFHILISPVYSSIYFPGTALLLVPAAWLGLANWVTPLVESAVAAGFLFLIFEELFGGTRALVAMLMLVSLYYFRRTALMALSESPMMLAETVIWWAWFHWRKLRDWKWAAVIGAAAGYAGITRPMDALCVAVPVGIAMFWQIRRQPRKIFAQAGILGVAAAPFIILQIIQNVGVTGSWKTFPSDYYVARNYPAPMLGFYRYDPAKIPTQSLLAKEAALLQFELPAYAQHRPSDVPGQWLPLPSNRGVPDRTSHLLLATLPKPLMAILLPAALLSMWEVRRAVIVAALALFVLGYACYVFFLDHYMFAVMPMVFCMILMGWESVERAFAGGRSGIFVFACLSLCGLAAAALPEIDTRPVPMGTFFETKIANDTIAAAVRAPALVLFRYESNECNFSDEPAYNDDVPFPDDAPIVRAHDLGDERNRILFAYYAKFQPRRRVYIFDRGYLLDPLRGPLGTVAELAAKPAPKPSSQPN